MAFAHLFSGLSTVEEGFKSPGQPAFTHRNESESGQRGNARKRKPQGEQTGPYQKKLRYDAQATRNYNNSKAIHYHMHNTHSEHARTKEVKHNQSYKAGHNKKGQNYTKQNNPNVNKQQQQKKRPEGQKDHQQKDRRKPANKGGSHQTQPAWGKGERYRQNRNGKQGQLYIVKNKANNAERAQTPPKIIHGDVQENHKRCMSQEFKDQNGVLVDGRLICRHFLWGRCIKEDSCQLEHVKGHNNLVKEVCKFYIQGFCTKGKSCPYMHESFPCKFFHSKGTCFQGADCKFSHEPLNDITRKLLHEMLKRDEDLYALSIKDKQEPSEQPENTDESEITEARTSDALLQPLMPNFYNSGEANAEEGTLLPQTEELADVVEEAVPPHASDAAQPHILPSSNLKHEEPVCYSVAAVLGPQLFKPFPHFYTTPESQESGSSVSANQSEVPYSVDAVLGSCKSVENYTFRHTPAPPTAKTVSYTPRTYVEDVTVPMLSSKIQDEKVLHSVNTRNEANNSQEKVFKSLSSLKVHTSLLSKNYPSLTLASRDNETQAGKMPESMEPAQRATYEVKLDMLHSPFTGSETSVLSKGDLKPLDVTCSDTSKSDGVLPFVRTNRKSIFPRQTSTFKHPTQLRPHLSVLPCDSKASKKLFSPSPCFTDFKGGATVPAVPVTSSFKTSDSANSGSCHFVEKPPTEIHLLSKKTQSVLNHDTRQPYSTKISAECSSKTAQDLAVGCKKTIKRPFHNLFASPITDTLQPIDNSVPRSSCAQGFIQSSCPAPQPAGCRSNPIKKAVEPDKAPARSFLSLFAAPLSAAPLQCIQSQPDYLRTSSCSQQSNQSVDNTSRLSNSEPSTSDLATPLQHQVNSVKEIYCAARSSYTSPNPKIELDPKIEFGSTEHIKKTTKQLLNPVCSLDSLSETSTSTTHAHQQLPNIASDKEADPANSVLKTLFLGLSPFHQDGEEQDRIQMRVSSDSRLQVQPSTEKTVAPSTEHQPSPQTPQIPLEGTAGSTLGSPGTTEPQVENSGSRKMRRKPVVGLKQHHTRSRLHHAAEEARVKGDVAVKPLKDLFKTLGNTVFHFGH